MGLDELRFGLALAAGLVFLNLHGPAGGDIYVNPMQIVSIRKADRALADGTNCVLIMEGGGIIATKETCAEIIRRLALTPLG